MQILLDTHIFIWWLNDDQQLTKQARSIIINTDNVYISSVSIWEAAIKIQLGKLDVDILELINSISSQGFIELPLQAKQCVITTKLPNIHRDPFDRMLLAQAISEPMHFLTSDAILKKYSELVKVV